MRLLCALLTTGAVMSSPWWTAQVHAQPPSDLPTSLYIPISDARVTPVTMTSVHPLEIEGAHTSPLPEPSAGFAIAVLGSAFLIRRRRPSLN